MPPHNHIARISKLDIPSLSRKRPSPATDTNHETNSEFEIPKRRRSTRSTTAADANAQSTRNPASRAAPDGSDGDDTSHSVLGGMRGGSRVDSEPAAEEDGVVSLKVPFEGKEIICQQYGNAPTPKLIFTHGAGGGLANPATADFARGFAEKDGVLCFQGTMNLQNRARSFKTVVEHVQSQQNESEQPKGLALGGRSMGARAACLAAQELNDIQALVLVSFPLTSPKGESRAKALEGIPEGVRVLFMSGDGDEMCDMKMLEDVRTKMKAESTIIVVKGADHGMSVKGGKEKVERLRKRTGKMASRWLNSETVEDSIEADE